MILPFSVSNGRGSLARGYIYGYGEVNFWLWVGDPCLLSRKSEVKSQKSEVLIIVIGKRSLYGEGGSGKTSLACQIASWAMSDIPEERLCKHQMLPILLEEEFNFKVAEGKQVFLEAIRGALRDLIDAEDALSEELLEQLLRKRRLLVIVDRFSEMSEATRNLIHPESPDFPVNALVVTSLPEKHQLNQIQLPDRYRKSLYFLPYLNYLSPPKYHGLFF